MVSKLDLRIKGCFGRPGLLFALVIYWSATLISPCSARDCHTSFRRAWRDLSCQEQDEFLDAIVEVKNTGIYDEFIQVHLSVAEWTHGPAEFLPWHRWFIWNFEKLLQETTGKCIYIPYWDWERDAEWERHSDVMHPATFGAWGATDRAGCATNGITVDHEPFQQSPGVDGGRPGCVTRDFLNGFSFSGEAQVLAIVANHNQFADNGRSNSFRTEFENGPHMLVHGVIAGHMGTNWSPADPLFYLHHANVDRIWTMWQDYWDHDTCSVDEYTAPWHYDSERALDEELSYGPSRRLSSWDFRMHYLDSDPAFPTVRDVMNNDGPIMSVRYQNSYLNTLMPDYEPNPRLFQAANNAVPIRCDRDEWEWSRKRRHLERGRKQEEVDKEHEELSTFTSTTEIEIDGSGPQRVFPGVFRSSLKGDDAKEIEDNIDKYFNRPGEGRVKNSLSANGADIIEVTNDVCGRPPVFTLQEDRDEWDRLCRELPANTPMAERLALLAESDCKRKGNPRSDAPELRERISMTMMKAFDGPSWAYECFHRPDQPPLDRN